MLPEARTDGEPGLVRAPVVSTYEVLAEEQQHFVLGGDAAD